MKKRTFAIVVGTTALLIVIGVYFYTLNKFSVALAKSNESLKRANEKISTYAKLVVPCVPDTLVKHKKMTDQQKIAWLEYQKTLNGLNRQYNALSAQLLKARDAAEGATIKNFEVAKRKPENSYGEFYNQHIQSLLSDTALVRFFISEPKNFSDINLYLGSMDSYWNVTVTFSNFAESKQGKHLPGKIKDALVLLNKANDAKLKTVAELEKSRDAAIAAAQQQYDVRINAAADNRDRLSDEALKRFVAIMK